MTINTLLGWLATTIFSLCYIPQLVRTFRRKEVGDISVWQWGIQLFGYAVGLIYGMHLQEFPLIFGYGWGLLCTLLFLAMYWRYTR